MNKTLEKYAREQIKIVLAKCSKKHQMKFKRIYSYENLMLMVSN